MRGRKPKPTALHELHGDPSHLRRQLAPRRATEPPPRADDLAAPDDLTETQRAIWTDAVACATPGILRRIDANALRVWVTACDLHRRACAQLNSSGLLVKPSTDPESKALPIPSPYLQIVNRQAALLLRAAEQLGFTPVSRPRLVGNSPLPPMPEPPGSSPKGQRPAVSLDEYIASAPPIPSLH